MSRGLNVCTHGHEPLDKVAVRCCQTSFMQRRHSGFIRLIYIQTKHQAILQQIEGLRPGPQMQPVLPTSQNLRKRNFLSLQQGR